MKMRLWYILFGVMGSTITGCKKLYIPKIADSNNNYLVVEGVINTSQDSTIIKLRRTVNISGKINTGAEPAARVTVEGDANNSYPLKEIGNGKYGSASLNLDPSRSYRLRVKTTDGKEYLSDLEPALKTPPIDSIYYTIEGNGIKIFADTHDPSNNTKYYRWDYTETWQFETPYISFYRSDTTEIVPRSPDKLVYSCFGNGGSGTILLASAANLQKSVIYQMPIAAIASTSEKLEKKYSILLRQYAINEEAFEFWQNLKKNTEELGSIFDALPSTISGNIHCINNPSTPVIGYISVSTIQTKRIFIGNEQLPQSWVRIYPYGCSVDTVLYPVDPLDINKVKTFLIDPPIVDVPLNKLGNRGFFYTSVECADCTIRGTTQQPTFWK